MLISSYSMTILVYIFFVYVLCGVIKGSIGFGMPTVSISLLSFVLDVKIIIALILIPTLVVNVYQLSRGGNFKKIISETKYFLFFSTIFIFPGAYLLKIINSNFLFFEINEYVIVKLIIANEINPRIFFPTIPDAKTSKLEVSISSLSCEIVSKSKICILYNGYGSMELEYLSIVSKFELVGSKIDKKLPVPGFTQ